MTLKTGLEVHQGHW